MQRYLYGIIIAAVVLSVMAAVTYKQEILTCNISKSTCAVTRINYYNIEKVEPLMSPHKVKDIEIEKYTEKRGRYNRRRVNRHKISFIGFNNERERIFVNGYVSESETQKSVTNIKQLFRNRSNIIEYKRYQNQ